MENYLRVTTSIILFALASPIVIGCASKSSEHASLNSNTGLKSFTGNSLVTSTKSGGGSNNQINSSPFSVSDNTGKTISTSLKNWKNTVSDKLTLKPKVTPPADPTQLATDVGVISPQLYVSAAQLLESQGNLSAAEGKYKKALELSPNNLSALVNYARMLHRQGNYPQSIAHYRRAVEAHPTSAVAFNDLGLCYARHGDVDLALNALRSAVQQQPNSKLYRNNIATVLVEANKVDEAFTHLAFAHGEAAAHYNLGFLFHKRGEDISAVEHFQKALALAPNLKEAELMLAQLGSESNQDNSAHAQILDPQKQKDSTDLDISSPNHQANKNLVPLEIRRTPPAMIPTQYRKSDMNSMKIESSDEQSKDQTIEEPSQPHSVQTPISGANPLSSSNDMNYQVARRTKSIYSTVRQPGYTSDFRDTGSLDQPPTPSQYDSSYSEQPRYLPPIVSAD